MPYIITWIDPSDDNYRKVSLQTLDEQKLKKHLFDKNIHNFEVEYFEYTEKK